MSRNTSNESQGADGQWFLDAVSGDTPDDSPPLPPEPGESPDIPPSTPHPVDETPAEGDPAIKPVEPPTPPNQHTVELVSFDGHPGTSTSSFDPIPVPPSPPSDLDDTAPPPEQSEPPKPPPTAPPPLAEEDATQLSPALRSRRNFRWPVVIVLSLGILAIAAAAFWLPRAVEQEALVIRQDYYDAASGVRNYLPTSQTALDAVTNPATTDETVAAAVPIISELDSLAFALEAVTAEPLPSVLPLVPSDPIEQLEPLQTRGSILGASASGVARRLGNAYVYRTSIPLLLDTGPLPSSATTQEINEISVRLAESLASDSGVVADLPEDEAFATVDVAAKAAVQRYATWQDEYLAALTSEDEATAAGLIAEIDHLRETLNVLNEEALLEFRGIADLAIVELAGALEAYMSDLSSS